MSMNTTKRNPQVHTLDLDFMGKAGAIASYLIPYANGIALIECGPGSTLPELEKRLQAFNISLYDVTDIFLTHIHLDHAGAAGWFARQGARIHVHQVGAPHLINPEKLLTSAGRIYGDMMESLWGEFIPVPEEQCIVLQDGDSVSLNGEPLIAIDTPGHAYHHLSYLYQGFCFTGDIGGVRLGGLRHLRLPMPPPEFHLELWRESLNRLQKMYAQGQISAIAPTHFGIYTDVAWHLESIGSALDEVESWLVEVMPADPPIEKLNQMFLEWSEARSKEDGLSLDDLSIFETANPSWMSSYGLQRYWHKYRKEQ